MLSILLVWRTCGIMLKNVNSNLASFNIWISMKISLHHVANCLLQHLEYCNCFYYSRLVDVKDDLLYQLSNWLHTDDFLKLKTAYCSSYFLQNYYFRRKSYSSCLVHTVKLLLSETALIPDILPVFVYFSSLHYITDHCTINCSNFFSWAVCTVVSIVSCPCMYCCWEPIHGKIIRHCLPWYVTVCESVNRNRLLGDSPFWLSLVLVKVRT